MSDTSLTIYTPPTLPTIGAAGGRFVDPTFGSRMERVTDGAWATDLGETNVGYHTSASGYQKQWNSTSSKFWVSTSDGWTALVSFDETAFLAGNRSTARIGNAFVLATGDIAWSDTQADIMYGITNSSPNRTLIKLDTTSFPPTRTNIVDLSTLMSAGLGGNVGALSFANGNLFCIFGSIQDAHQYVLWYPLANPSGYKILQTKTDANRGADAAGNTKDARLDVAFGMHSAQIDQSGRVISIIPGGGQGAQPVYFWDTTANTVTAGTGPNSGHEVLGNMRRINNDSIGTYDSRKWVLTPDLTTPNTGKVSLPTSGTPISPVVGGWGADHSCWHNSAANPLAPFISGSYRYGDGPEYSQGYPVLNHLADAPSFLTPWRPWDDEIISVSTDGSGVVYRHCHTRSRLTRDVPANEPSALSDIFWYTPRPNISPNGRYAVFNSNWDKTLGTEAGTGIRRVDVFLVELTFGSTRKHRRLRRLS